MMMVMGNGDMGDGDGNDDGVGDDVDSGGDG